MIPIDSYIRTAVSQTSASFSPTISYHFFSLSRKARNVDYILIAPKGRYHNPRPAGAVKPPNPPAGGPVNLKNLFPNKKSL